MQIAVTGGARQSFDYAPTLSSSTTPSSNPDLPMTSQEVLVPPSILTLSTTTSTSSTTSTTRSSLDLLKMDFSTLLRSRSKTERQRLSVVADGTEEPEMVENDEHERRKSNSENRFYSFLTRSRSRSSRRTTASDAQDSLHSRNSSWSSARSSQKRPMSSTTATSSKPSTIVQSRPISTATNTTITPPTPKTRRQLSSSTPKPADLSGPKSPTTAKKRLHNIFGRKSVDSRSRGVSPEPHGTDEIYHGSTARIHSRSSSPTPLFPRTRQNSSEPSMSKLENIFKPTRLFSSARRAQSPPPALSLSQSRNMVSPMSTPSSSNSGSSVPVVSGPSKHASTSKITRRRASTNESISSMSSAHRTAPVVTPQPIDTTHLPPPRITHTPATPSRSPTAPARLSQNQTHRKDSLESGYRYRPLVMDMVDEERDSRELDVKGKRKETDGFHPSRSSSKGKDSDHSSASGHKSSNHHHHSTRHPPIKPKSNLAHIRSAKHGSFDFERPIWGLAGASVARSLSGTSGNSGVTGFSGGRHNNRSGESVGSVPRDKERRAKVSKKEEHKHHERNADADDDPVPPYSATGPSPGAGLSSSLGRSSGKGTGIARLIGIGGLATHGALPFEPPVPSPISPTFSQTSHESNANRRKEVISDRERESRRSDKDKDTGKDEKERARDRKRHTEHDTIGLSRMSSSTGRKGRSLDLGIGLSWASSKVREDALLPGGVFANAKDLNGRLSDSTSSRAGLRASRDKPVDEFGVEDRSKVGRDVAEVFKKALDPEGYSAFKRYIHQFDAHEIPFDGPNGIIARSQRLLDKRSAMGEESKRNLIDRLVKIVLQNA